MFMTVDMLSALGSCGGYVQTFRDLFPTDEHPDGVEITVENCVKHAGHFDWNWAADVMLTSDAYREWDQNSYNSTRSDRARRFAELFANPENRQTEKLERLVERADRNAEARELDELSALERKVTEARELVESLPELEAKLEQIRERIATADVRRRQRRVERAAAKVAEAQAHLARLEAELAEQEAAVDAAQPVAATS